MTDFRLRVDNYWLASAYGCGYYRRFVGTCLQHSQELTEFTYIDPEDGRSMYLRNVGNIANSHTV
jgi:hypothetical protein